jgi:RNA polymerase sigma factor (sigma-70 family)
MASDAELARRIQAGDAGAFTDLYEHYVAPIHDFVARTVRDLSTAEDITQATFIQAWTQRDSLKDPAAVKGWLYRIAHNLALNHVTRTKPSAELSDDVFAAVGAGPEEQAISAEAATLVWDAAVSLEPRQHSVLELAVRQELTTAEIASVLEINHAQASLAVHRAKDALRNAVRFLLVARRRNHCERLAELVPEGVRQLTTEQRATVDRHMRRCENCSDLADSLTKPAEILGGLLLLPVPESLKTAPHLKLTGAHLDAGANLASRLKKLRERTSRRAIVGLVALLLLLIAGGITVPLTLGHTASAPITLRPTSLPTSLVTTTSNPTLAPSPTPSTVPTATQVPPKAKVAPTPEQPFGVLSSTLCFVDITSTCNPGNTSIQTCTQVTPPEWTCNYQIAFQLAPGTGGVLNWTMSGTFLTGCGTGPAMPFTVSGKVNVATAANSSNTTGTLTLSSKPNSYGPSPISSATVTTPQGSASTHNTAEFLGPHDYC